ncbi:ribosome maturation factor RimM [Oscillatoriales cyanobacterium USR001]|nr:ribosome maturation factor RimM [Oscillatoriales cyanobacterium USR001]
MSDWIEIGKIVAPQGLHGQVRVYPNSDFPERFLEPGQRWVQRPGKAEPEPIEFLGGRYIPGKGIYAVQLAGIESVDQAEALRGCLLFVSASDRPSLEPGEFYVRDLVGLEVFYQETGEMLGTVVDIIPAGNDLLEVELLQQSGKEENLGVAEVVDEVHKDRRKKPKQRSIKSKPKTVLIPFVESIVPIVEIENRRIEITPPPGLFDSD